MALATIPVATPSLSRLQDALRRSWSAETSADAARWSEENPALGQCAVSALIIQDHFGGELLRCDSPTGSHYFNQLDDGERLDMTSDQFAGGFVPSHPELRDRDYVLSFAETRHRYEKLRRRVDATLHG
jgi:hypothetical protein